MECASQQFTQFLHANGKCVGNIFYICFLLRVCELIRFAFMIAIKKNTHEFILIDLYVARDITQVVCS